MKINARQEAILEIIEKKEISTQGELTQMLIEQGFNATQATVSRDINDLELIKTTGTVRKFRYARKERDEKFNKYAKIFKESVINIDTAMNIIVVKTFNGNANAASVLIDSLHLPLVVGTLAGDDTILVIVKDADNVQKVVKILKEYL